MLTAIRTAARKVEVAIHTDARNQTLVWAAVDTVPVTLTVVPETGNVTLTVALQIPACTENVIPTAAPLQVSATLMDVRQLTIIAVQAHATPTAAQGTENATPMVALRIMAPVVRVILMVARPSENVTPTVALKTDCYFGT